MYYRITDGIRVTVHPRYLPEHSDLFAPRHVFGYRIRIENVGAQPAQLIWRHWYIHDALAGDSEVEGEGVVGEQPLLAPGDVHEYQSFCVLQGTEGSMEGTFEFLRPDGTRFKAAIPRFALHLTKEEPK
ncbi:MAG TPA: Co2+/Mg2+ efflux protein ApaG [Longimicrobium sp.]|nr:Co2+/Mg2+ efflux protein ApaG [Longimicrobium sp.]